MPRLRRSRCAEPGIRRRRSGRGFRYVDAAGTAIADPAELERITALAIPPAWTGVWICPYPNGHIQATGVDQAGRRQYLYHPAWRSRSDDEKFVRMLELARALPAARRGATRDLRHAGLGRERLLAGAFRLLDAGSLRIGSPRYEEERGTIGLTTLLVRHAVVEGTTVRLRFPGKSGQAWRSLLDDADLAALIAPLTARSRRARLLAWQDAAGRWHPLRPAEVNADIRRRLGGEFSAKDFRTLCGTATAALRLAAIGARPTASGRRRAIAEAVSAAADVLGNTPAIARGSYVDPRILDRYEHGETVPTAHAVETGLVELLS